MDQTALEAALDGLPLGGVRYLPSTGSTNDAAMSWAVEGSPDMALVAADEQTAGKGRSGRHWFTLPGTALAFSLVLRPPNRKPLSSPGRLTSLGALAVCETLHEHYQLAAQVKWPNDVLVGGKKLCGVLVEAVWQADAMQAAVVGIGVNVTARSIPPGIPLAFPATCLEAEAQSQVERLMLLQQILENFLRWRANMDSPFFLQRLEDRLALRESPIRIIRQGYADLEGMIAGLEADGALRLRQANGEISVIQFGELHLRTVDSTPD